MTIVLAVYVGLGLILWVSAFGYLTALRLLVRRRPTAALPNTALPRLAVIIPTLNEELFIEAKLRDLARTDYPPERLTIVAVDGGSSDQTVTLLKKEAPGNMRVRVVSVPQAPSKTDQIRSALRAVNEDMVVITDADSELGPACLRELVSGLLGDPQTALLAAVIKPATGLLEERIHWRFLNYLWWLEGEALGSGMFSAVCYAIRRSALLPLLPRLRQEKADDVHLAHLLAAERLRVRTCRRALATEVRVPRTPGELLEFRGRRGVKYLRALKTALPRTGAPFGAKLARWVRLWHFLVSPAIVSVLAVTSVGLLLAGCWAYPALMGIAFLTPALVLLFTSSTPSERGWARFGLAGAGFRLVFLTWLSLVKVIRLARPQAACKET